MFDDYLAKLSRLRSDRSPARWGANTKHRAPHKPLLLLAVLDELAEADLPTNLIEPSLELGELFTLYWARVMPTDQRGNMALPFFHLHSDGFWHLIPKSDKEDYVSAVRQIRSISELRDNVFGAKLDDDLYTLLCVSSSREAIRRLLIETYFTSDTQAALTEQGVVNQEAYVYSEKLLKQAKENLVNERSSEEAIYRPAIRDQGFRRAVIRAYRHTCAFCGLCVLTPDGHTAADAAHIVPWSRTRDDSLKNGMALCKLCHWAFDAGLLAGSSTYSIQISRQLLAAYNTPAHLPSLKDRKMTLPVEEAFWPDLQALKWHRQQVFRTL